MKCIIDRFEGNKVLLELGDGTVISADRRLVPPESAEGDIILIMIDNNSTSKKKEEIEATMNELFE